jgi:hypothetical protein
MLAKALRFFTFYDALALFSDRFSCGLENLASSSILKRQGDLACINANF